MNQDTSCTICKTRKYCPICIVRRLVAGGMTEEAAKAAEIKTRKAGA
jgi:hypothetical protein